MTLFHFNEQLHGITTYQFWNSVIQLAITPKGATMSTDSIFPASNNPLRKPITWMVFPMLWKNSQISLRENR